MERRQYKKSGGTEQGGPDDSSRTPGIQPQKRDYAHEKDPADLAAAYEKLFKKSKAAWNFFERQAPSYKRMVIHWIMSAKQEKTRLSRLEKAIAESGQQKRIKFM